MAKPEATFPGDSREPAHHSWAGLSSSFVDGEAEGPP